MNAELKQWLDAEMKDYEKVFKAFNSGTMKKVPLWMALCVIGLVALGFGVGGGLDTVLRIHLPVGVGMALFVWLCFWIQTRSVSMKKVRASYEKALGGLSPADQAAFVRQGPLCGRIGFENRMTDKYPARLMVGPDFWVYFREACQVFKVADIQKLHARQETTRVGYDLGKTHVRQSLGVGVSLVAEGAGKIYLENAKQLEQAEELIKKYCPKGKELLQ